MTFFSFHCGFERAPSRHALAFAFARAGATLCLVIAAACFASAAWAAEGQVKGSEAILLTQILLLICFGGLLGELMLRIGQPAVIAAAGSQRRPHGSIQAGRHGVTVCGRATPRPACRRRR
jgi:hypothetical protein